MELFDILQYEHNKAEDIFDIDTAWEPIVEVTLTPNEDGPKVYEVGFSLTGSFDATNRSSMMRYSVNGGTTWFEMEKENKDDDDTVHFYKTFPYAVDDLEPINLQIEARKSGGDDDYDIAFADVWLERKK